MRNYYGEPGEVYERHDEALMFSYVGSGGGIYERLKGKYSESRTWHGVVYIVLANGTVQTWKREKVALQ